MLISQNSYFYNPPKRLLSEQVVVFNAIRYSLEICDLSYLRLKANLLTFALSDSNARPAVSSLYSDVWVIIQQLSIFYKILKTQFKIPETDPVFDVFNDLINLRNTSQHLDERITEVLSKNDLSIYGTLSWYSKSDSNTAEGIVTTLFSGTITDKNAVVSKLSNPILTKSDELVYHIEFTGITKPKRKVEHYIEKKILLDQIMNKTQLVVKHFEDQIHEQTKNFDVSERHISDLIIQLLVRTVN